MSIRRPLWPRRYFQAALRETYLPMLTFGLPAVPYLWSVPPLCV
jgi:hypothetical protein